MRCTTSFISNMSEDSAYADFLMRIADILPLVINMTSVIIGIIGGICNLITFTAPNLRNNATVFYLLCATVFQTLCLIFPVSTRIALDNFGNNLEQESLAFCKLRYYVAIVWPQLVTSYILLATADRYFATSNSVRVRAWSSIKVAMRLSIIVLIGSHAMTSHSLVFYEIQHNACQVPPGTAYTIFFAVYLIFVISVAPHCAMFVFSILTFRNLRLRTQIVPLSDAVARRQKRQGLKRFEFQLITVNRDFSCLSNRLGFLYRSRLSLFKSFSALFWSFYDWVLTPTQRSQAVGLISRPFLVQQKSSHFV